MQQRQHHPDCARAKLPARIYCSCNLETEVEESPFQLTGTFEHYVPTDGGGKVLYKTVHTYQVSDETAIKVVIDGQWHDDDTIRHAEVLFTTKDRGKNGQQFERQHAVCTIRMDSPGVFGMRQKLRETMINWTAWGSTSFDDTVSWHGAMGIALFWAQLWNVECKYINKRIEKEEADAATAEDAAVQSA